MNRRRLILAAGASAALVAAHALAQATRAPRLIAWLGVSNRENGRPYFPMNRAWESASSMLTPSTTASDFLMGLIASRNPQASLVQPDVSSLG